MLDKYSMVPSSKFFAKTFQGYQNNQISMSNVYSDKFSDGISDNVQDNLIGTLLKSKHFGGENGFTD